MPEALARRAREVWLEAEAEPVRFPSHPRDASRQVAWTQLYGRYMMTSGRIRWRRRLGEQQAGQAGDDEAQDDRPENNDAAAGGAGLQPPAKLQEQGVTRGTQGRGLFEHV